MEALGLLLTPNRGKGVQLQIRGAGVSVRRVQLEKKIVMAYHVVIPVKRTGL
jgi:hypothetical protein